MSDFQQWVSGDAAPWLPVNENFEALEGASLYGWDQDGTSGLAWGYMGGVFKDTTKAKGTTTLADATTNYVVAALSDGTISDATTTTNWDDETTYARVAKVTTSGGQITAVVDYRYDEFGLFAMLAATTGAVSSVNGATGAVTLADLQETGLNVDAVGFRGVPPNSQSGNYTTVAADAGKCIVHPSGAGAGDTFTIDSNANVAYEVGTAITFVNMDSNSLSIAITTDTMNLAGAGTTGTRTLTQYGIATALKVASTTWLISGTNLT